MFEISLYEQHQPPSRRLFRAPDVALEPTPTPEPVQERPVAAQPVTPEIPATTTAALAAAEENQLKKSQFPEWIRQVLETALLKLALEVLEPLPQSKLEMFEDIVMHDGISFASMFQRYIAHATELVTKMELSMQRVAKSTQHFLPAIIAALLSLSLSRIISALKAALEFLKVNATRAHPERDRLKGRLQAGLRPIASAQVTTYDKNLLCCYFPIDTNQSNHTINTFVWQQPLTQ